MKIPSVWLNPLYKAHSDEYEQKALEILRSGWYVLGEEVSAFEREFAEWIGRNTAWGWAAAWMRFGSVSACLG